MKNEMLILSEQSLSDNQEILSRMTMLEGIAKTNKRAIEKQNEAIQSLNTVVVENRGQIKELAGRVSNIEVNISVITDTLLDHIDEVDVSQNVSCSLLLVRVRAPSRLSYSFSFCTFYEHLKQGMNALFDSIVDKLKVDAGCSNVSFGRMPEKSDYFERFRSSLKKKHGIKFTKDGKAAKVMPKSEVERAYNRYLASKAKQEKSRTVPVPLPDTTAQAVLFLVLAGKTVTAISSTHLEACGYTTDDTNSIWLENQLRVTIRRVFNKEKKDLGLPQWTKILSEPDIAKRVAIIEEANFTESQKTNFCRHIPYNLMPSIWDALAQIGWTIPSEDD